MWVSGYGVAAIILTVFSAIPWTFAYLEVGRFIGPIPVLEYFILALFAAAVSLVSFLASMKLKKKWAVWVSANLVISLVILSVVIFSFSLVFMPQVSQADKKIDTFITENANSSFQDYVTNLSSFLDNNVGKAYGRPEASFRIDDLISGTLLDPYIMQIWSVTRADLIIYQGWGACGQAALLIEELLQRVFLYYFGRFCHFAKMTPDQLIDERKRHLKSDDEFLRRKHEELAEKFSTMLRDREEASPNTVATAVAAVRSFYKANYMPLVEVSVPTPYPIREVKVPTPKELRAMVDICDDEKDILTKAWILCQAESGISNIDLHKLELKSRWCHSAEFGHIREQLKNGTAPLHIHIVREKTMASGLGWYDTFFGKWAVEALKEYVDFSKPRLFDVSDRTIQLKLREISIKAGVGTEEGPVRPYDLRKYFNTCLKLAGINETLVEYMMGHSLGRVRGAYFVPPVLELRKVYSQYYPYISIRNRS